MLNGLKYAYMNHNRFSERIGASCRRETSFGDLVRYAPLSLTFSPHGRFGDYEVFDRPIRHGLIE